MAKYYYIDCREVGYSDCDFCTDGQTIEEVVEHCAEHGRAEHGLRGFGNELYARMRVHIRVRDTGDPAVNEPLT